MFRQRDVLSDIAHRMVHLTPEAAPHPPEHHSPNLVDLADDEAHRGSLVVWAEGEGPMATISQIALVSHVRRARHQPRKMDQGPDGPAYAVGSGVSEHSRDGRVGTRRFNHELTTHGPGVSIGGHRLSEVTTMATRDLNTVIRQGRRGQGSTGRPPHSIG